MKDYTVKDNTLTIEEANRISNMAKGMSIAEKEVFLKSVESSFLWTELIRREKENAETLMKLTELVMNAK